ncbi:MAG: two-component system, OmpR family, sensor kinase [Frankiaceae bacterium]|nr:two-component system, OmpR family, sensor kinase [Frankiaceae bacterium]
MTRSSYKLSSRTPLRVQLVAAMVMLVTVALLGAGLLASTLLRGYLVSVDDQQLKAVVTEAVQCTLTTSSSGVVVQGPNQRSCGHPQPDGTNRLGTTPRAGTAAGTTPNSRPLGPPSPFLVQFSHPDGSVYDEVRNPLRSGEVTPALPALTVAQARALDGKPFTVKGVSGADEWRVLAAPLTSGDGSVMVAQSLGNVDGTIARLAKLEGIVGLVLLLAVALVARFLVRRSLRPLEDVETTAEAIAAGDLTRRLPDDAHPTTEVGRLSASLNGMLQQIEGAFAERQSSETNARRSEERMRRFVADASHELRTPLTSIHGFADLVGRGGVRDLDEVVRVMARIEGEADRMRALVEDLLLLARLDEKRPLVLVPVPLVDVAADVVLDAQALAPERSIEIEVADDEPPIAMGDPVRLRQVITNLVRNALVHTPSTASVTVKLSTLSEDGADWASLEVIDDGPGIDAADAGLVFGRFYRVEESRTRDQGGSGLGLSIVQAVVAAHGGRVELDTALGEGATFRVLLPLAPGVPTLEREAGRLLPSELRGA